LIELAHGRTSSYVRSDIGAMAPGRWQSWQDRWRMGAMSLVNVGVGSTWPAAASAGTALRTPAANDATHNPEDRRQFNSPVMS
jgi:hypothetical protein